MDLSGGSENRVFRRFPGVELPIGANVGESRVDVGAGQCRAGGYWPSTPLLLRQGFPYAEASADETEVKKASEDRSRGFATGDRSRVKNQNSPVNRLKLRFFEYGCPASVIRFR